MPEPTADQPANARAAEAGVGDLIQLVKDYARQETLGPLKGWGRYIGLGVAGAFVMGLGLIVALLGILRLLQTETTAFSGPNTSIVAYLITLAACVVIVGLAVWQISRRTTLQRKERSR